MLSPNLLREDLVVEVAIWERRLGGRGNGGRGTGVLGMRSVRTKAVQLIRSSEEAQLWCSVLCNANFAVACICVFV